MPDPTIPNVACMAAELTAAVPALRKRPYAAAHLATQLVALGKRYRKVCERLANGLHEPQHSRATEHREALWDEALILLNPYRRWTWLERRDLAFAVVTRVDGRECNTVAL